MQQRVVLVRRRGAAHTGSRVRSRARAARSAPPRAQVNSFVIDTAHLLNRFASQAERSMERVDECVALPLACHAALA
jgi:hypothetical protein